MKTLNIFLLFFFLFSIDSYSLAKCKDDRALWDNCSGAITIKNGDRYEGEFKNGKYHGRGAITFISGDFLA